MTNFFFSSLRRAIEEKVFELCGDLAKECIVVGHLRPSPALFIEAPDNASSTMSEDDLKESVIRRMQDFNSRQYVQERITDKRLIFVVNKGTLPRTVSRFFFVTSCLMESRHVFFSQLDEGKFQVCYSVLPHLPFPECGT